MSVKQTIEAFGFEVHKRRIEEYGFEGFCNAFGYQLAAHHKLIAQKLETLIKTPDYNLMICMPPGSAKALALDTPIPTPNGWSMMSELTVGDKVFDENGHPCNVTWVSPIWRDRPVYSLTTDCGDTIIADKDHEWLVRLCGGYKVFKIKKTHELHKKRAKRPMIQRAKALDCPDIDLPVDPYLLGAWLGDGHSAGMRMTSSKDDIQWMRSEIERLGYKTSNSSQSTLFGVLGVRGKFVAMGLLNEPPHKTYGRKHIPLIYMRSSISQRLSLLQGLIDTDGTVCKKRGCATFCNTNLELALQVRELVRSLGIKAGWSVSRAMLYDKDCGKSYKVSFYHAQAARMPRKLALCRDQYRTPNTYIDVFPRGYADTVCIEVDSPSHLFLCGESMTPTHNSTYGSILFPSYVLGKIPGSSIVTAAHTAELASKWGRSCKRILSNPLYNYAMGAKLNHDSQSADRFDLSNGSEYIASGVGGSITGNRMNIGIIDDPTRSREDADSERIRDKIWDWYVNDFCTRAKPGVRKMIINTRWHEDDLSGRILMSADKGNWDVLTLPAIAEPGDQLGREPGEVLWPEYITKEMVYQIKAITDPRTWNSLYQQKPSLDEGSYFKSDWIQIIEELPEGLKLNHYGGSDYAVSADRGDYTVHLVIGHDDKTDNIYVIDMWRAQAESNIWIEHFINLCLKHEPLMWGEEQGQIMKSLNPFIEKEMVRRRCYTFRQQFTSMHDKTVRARAIQAYMAQKRVFILNREWTDDFILELLKFPTGKHDDAVDSFGLIGRMLDEMRMAVEKKLKKVEYEYKSGTIMLPGLKDKIGPQKGSYQRI